MNGDSVQLHAFDPYGNALDGAIANGTNYKRQETDQETGLYFLRARYYNPAIGTFLSRDPVEGDIISPQTQHGYSYANGNPISNSDPSGKNPYLFAAGAYTLLALEVGGAAYGAYNSCDPSFVGRAKSAVVGAQRAVESPIGQVALGSATFGLALAANSPRGTSSSSYDITFKTDHGMRHFGNTNLTSDVIESAIKSDVLSKGAGGVGQNVERTLNVGGTDIVYRANMWKEGTINVGTYFLKQK